MDVFFSFLLTAVAGLSTGIGSLIAFFAKKTNKRFLAISLGFSAGVMIFVALVEIYQEAFHNLSAHLGESWGGWVTILSFFGGIGLIAIIDKLIPEGENPHEAKAVLADCPECEKRHMMRTGAFTALAIAIHNFPEGLAAFVSALEEPTVALPIVAAIAIHNIPEGISVAVPIYQATGSRKRAFWYSFLSGLAEPIGALVGWLLLMPLLETSGAVLGVVFGVVAGIMVFISVDELLPAAREYGENHLSIYGLVGGMALRAVSLQLFK